MPAKQAKKCSSGFKINPTIDNIVANIGLSLEEELSSLVSRDTKKDLHSSVR
jgi:hypothetical protein